MLAAAEERLLDVHLVGGLLVGLELGDDVVVVVSCMVESGIVSQ